MIVAENPKPSLLEFQSLMKDVDTLLNKDALIRPDYYASKSGITLEPDIRDAAIECSKGTKFEGSITLVSGSSFPDIVAAKYYGIEVKSTQSNHWTSIGSSILESTRVADVERIYLTFGKLGKPVQFLSKPYEECLSGIAVTHYPRYQIDMTLKQGQSIFDKMGIAYDTLRSMDNPVEPVAAYYKSKLREGESLWWAGNAVDSVEASVPPTVRIWSTLPAEEKRYYETLFYVFFPECIMSSSTSKYSRLTLWLATQRSIIHSNVRDSFSAGGQVMMPTLDNIYVKMPRIFANIQKQATSIAEILVNTEPQSLYGYWEEPIDNNRIKQWIRMVIREGSSDSEKRTAQSILSRIFIDAGVL